MKKLAIVVLALAVLLLALPPVFGRLTERQVYLQAESMSAEQRVEIAVESYERGWFSSRALVAISPHPARAASGSPPQLVDETLVGMIETPLEVEIDFDHGPVSLQNGFFLGFSRFSARPAPETALPSNGLAPRPVFKFEAQSTFDGQLHFLARIEPLEQNIDGREVSFSGGSIAGTASQRTFRAQAAADFLQIRDGAATLSVFGLSAHLENEQMPTYIRPGEFTLSIDRAALDLGYSDDRTLVETSGFRIEGRTTLDSTDQLASGRLLLGFDRARAIGDIHVTDARFDGRSENLDAAALEDYLSAALRDGDAPGATPAPSLDRLVASGPNLSIAPLRFQLNGDQFDAELHAEVDPSGLGPNDDLTDPAVWSAILSARADVTAAKPIVERFAVAIIRSQLGGQVMQGESLPTESLETLARARAGLVISLLAAQGILEDTGSFYRIRLSLEDGRLDVNGQVVPLSLLTLL